MAANALADRPCRINLISEPVLAWWFRYMGYTQIVGDAGVLYPVLATARRIGLILRK